MSANGPPQAYSPGADRELGINEYVLSRIEQLRSLQGSFRCRCCGECCQQEAVAFTMADVSRAADYKDLTRERFVEEHGLILVNEPGGLQFYQLRIGGSGICPFNSNRRCTIYDARPQVCRGFPFLTPENVQNAFRMSNEVVVSGKCKAAMELVRTVSTLPAKSTTHHIK
jgi:Fe-S-cluster containining protein